MEGTEATFNQTEFGVIAESRGLARAKDANRHFLVNR